MMKFLGTDIEAREFEQLLTTIQLSNLAMIGQRKSIEVEALVDTGATALCITEDQARDLGRDLEEAEQRSILLANDIQEQAWYLPMIELNYGGLDLVVNAYCIPGSNTALLGAVPLEELGLVLDLGRQKLEPRVACAKFMQPRTRLVVVK